MNDIPKISLRYWYWLVVLTILKNTSQWEGLSWLSHTLWKIMFETTNQDNVSITFPSFPSPCRRSTRSPQCIPWRSRNEGVARQRRRPPPCRASPRHRWGHGPAPLPWAVGCGAMGCKMVKKTWEKTGEYNNMVKNMGNMVKKMDMMKKHTLRTSKKMGERYW